MKLWGKRSRVQVMWRNKRDLNPPPMKGYAVLQIEWPWWARLPAGVHVSPYSVNLWLRVWSGMVNLSVRRGA